MGINIEIGAGLAAHTLTDRTINRQFYPGLVRTAVWSGSLCELHLTVTPIQGQSLDQMIRRLTGVLQEEAAAVVRMEAFGSLEAYHPLLEVLRAELGTVDWPVAFIEGQSCDGDWIAGVHVFAVSGVSVETLCLDGRPAGRIFGNASARHLIIGGLHSPDSEALRPVQTEHVLGALKKALNAADMDFSNLARTWFFLDSLLQWYGPFNEARTRFFHEHEVFHGLLPASTGISGKNIANSAASLGAWAVQPLDADVSVCEVPSPLQGPAPEYGSSFSRAVEIRAHGVRRLLVSGTASIEADGSSVFEGDAAAQIDFTMRVVEGILRSREMGFEDVSRATAYIKHPGDAQYFRAWLAKAGLEAWPVFCVHADICREELLFEIELDALALE